MTLNLLKKYNQLLELEAFNEQQRKEYLLGIFNRDIKDNQNFSFRYKSIHPTPIDGEIKMEMLFTHLTTVIVDKETKKREFDIHRSVRLHWIRYHIEEKKKDNMLVLSVKEPKGMRTYIYDKDEKYVIILEPKRNLSEYYLLTAYYLRGRDAKRNKILKKYRRRLKEVL